MPPIDGAAEEKKKESGSTGNDHVRLVSIKQAVPFIPISLPAEPVFFTDSLAMAF